MIQRSQISTQRFMLNNLQGNNELDVIPSPSKNIFYLIQ